MKKKRIFIFAMATACILQSCINPIQKASVAGLEEIQPVRRNLISCQEKTDDYVYELDSGNKYSDHKSDDFETSNYAEQSRNYYSVSEDPNGNVLSETSNTNQESISTVAFNDQKENNDSFAEASAIYKAGTDVNGVYWHSVTVHATISQKSEGWLWKKYYIDKDFYSFDMVSVGTLTIDLTQVPSNCDYDLRVYKLSNTGTTSYEELDFNNPSHIYAQSKAGGVGQNEHIQIANATPGTFYIVVYSYQDNYFDNDNPYKLVVQEQVNTQRANTFYTISSGRSSGQKFALWKSDYNPLGINALSTTNDNARIAFSNYDKYPMIRHLSDKYTNGTNCNYAVMYVWDLEVRRSLHSFYSALLQSLNGKFFDGYGNEINHDENKEETFDIVYNSVGFAVSIAGVVGCFFPVVGWVASGVSFFMSFYSLVKSCNKKHFLITKRQFRDYLINIVAALEVGTGSNNNEVVMVKFQYRSYVENGVRYLDWSPILDLSNGNRYNKDTISWQIDGSGIDGTVRGFATQSDIDIFLGLC